jgi:7-cyano-7-deazaguanine reductase
MDGTSDTRKPRRASEKASAKASPGGPDAGEKEPYGTAAIKENTLERWSNPEPARPYLISMDLPEFTCLCPRSGYPDFALVKIRYQPRDWIVELKSLKLYINGYRDQALSHEAVANRILDDLVALLDPRWMRVTADFNVRGNIKTVVRVQHGAREKA